MTKNADTVKYFYSEYDTSIDTCGKFSSPDGSGSGKNVIFHVDNSFYAGIDNKNKDILILGNSPRQGLDDATLTREAEYSANINEQAKKKKKKCLGLHCNGTNIFILK